MNSSSFTWHMAGRHAVCITAKEMSMKPCNLRKFGVSDILHIAQDNKCITLYQPSNYYSSKFCFFSHNSTALDKNTLAQIFNILTYTFSMLNKICYRIFFPYPDFYSKLQAQIWVDEGIIYLLHCTYSQPGGSCFFIFTMPLIPASPTWEQLSTMLVEATLMKWIIIYLTRHPQYVRLQDVGNIIISISLHTVHHWHQE